MIKRSAFLSEGSGAHPLVIGLNPSPVAPSAPWYEGANATGAMAYLAFDLPQSPGTCRQHFDMRNLNNRMIDEREISKIDPIEAMQRLTTWWEEGAFTRPVVACGKTVALMVRAFVEARKIKGVKLVEIPHPGCLWRTGKRGEVPIEAWARARIRLRRVLELPPLPQVDAYGIENAFCGFGHYVDCLDQREVSEQHLPIELTFASEDDEWDDEIRYWRRVAADDHEDDIRENYSRAESIVGSNTYYE